jgi:hypothetical protein
LTGIASLSSAGTLNLRGIYFEGPGNFVFKPLDPPNGVTAANITIVVVANTTLEIVPQSIDPTTTAFPLVLLYSPLGFGAR